MAGRATITVQEITRAGIVPSFAAGDANGHQFVNDGNTYLEVKNSDAQTTLTITVPATEFGLSFTAPAITIPATTGNKIIGPFPPSLFNNAGSLVFIDFLAVTGITVAAFRLPRV
jgi:hypothetical protein